jgi:predicted dehydrogenase
MRDLLQAWPRPGHPRPIVVIGAGAIVRTAHLPAYNRLDLPVAGFYDVDVAQARETAASVAGGRAFDTLDEAARTPDAVFDVAVPGDQIVGILERLPRGSAVLIQKPMGPDLASARRILACCEERSLVATINFQLRFAPAMLALHDLIARGDLGSLVDIDVRVVIEQPWRNWTFMEGAPRVEIVYHSIHYVDAIRWLAGEPRGAYCKAVAHPAMPQLRDTRSSIILDYGDAVRCSLVLNHTHKADPTHKTSQIIVEGLKGAARVTWGVNLDYPSGPPDSMQITSGGAWTDVPLRGSWFTEAFEGPMSNLQRYIAGEDSVLVSSVEDAVNTMAVVEACYESSAGGATPIPSIWRRE